MGVGILGLPISASEVIVDPAVLDETNGQAALEALASGVGRPFHGARIHLGASQATTGAPGTVLLDTPDHDSDGYVDLTVHGLRVPVGSGLAGVYRITWGLLWNSTAAVVAKAETDTFGLTYLAALANGQLGDQRVHTHTKALDEDDWVNMPMGISNGAGVPVAGTYIGHPNGTFIEWEYLGVIA
jgi:hypothetical protein